MRWFRRKDEEQRLKELRDYQILDTPPEEAFDEIVHLAAKICHTPNAFIAFIDRNRLWLKASIAKGKTEMPRDLTLCNLTILQSDILIIPDTLEDERSFNSPNVTNYPYLRFYAGIPLINKNKYILGSLCVTDYIPHNLTSQQIDALKQLADQVIHLLEWRRNLNKISHSPNGNTEKLPRRLFRQMGVGFGLSISFITSFGIGIYYSNWQVSKNNRWVNHTFNVLSQIEAIRSNTQTIESNSRGYVITGKDAYLNPYYKTLAELETNVADLKKLTLDNYKQQERIKVLEPLLIQKNELHNSIIDVRKTQGFTAAWKLVNNDQGYYLGVEISRQLQRMANEENALLQKRTSQSQQSSQISTIILLIGIGITLVIMVFLYSIIYREINKRYQSELALQKQAEFTTAILDTAPAVILVLNREGRMVKINQAAQQMSEYSSEQITGKYVWEVFLPEEEIEAAKTRVEKIKNSLYPQTYQVYWLNKDGEKRLLEFVNTSLLDSHGQVEYIIKIGLDITERHQAEIELEKQREWLQVTLSSIGDGVITTDEKGLITFINPVTEAITGWTVEQTIGKHLDEIFKLVHAHTQESLLTPLRKTLEQGKIINLEENTNLISANGLQIPVDDSCAPIKNRQGEIEGAVMVFRDVAERKRLEEERNKFFSLSPNLFAILDSRGNFLRVNPAWYQILGFTEKDLLGKNYFDLVAPQEPKSRLFQIRTLLRSDELTGIENQFLDKSGNSHWFLWNAVKTENQVIFICGLDIKDQKEKENQHKLAFEKEKELNQLKSRFLSLVSHEFRTPLTSLLLSSDVLESSWETIKPERRDKHFYQIKNSIQRMMDLLNDVLVLNQAETGRLKYQPSELDLVSFLKNIVEEFHLGIGQHHTIKFITDQDSLKGNFDKKLLENIFINLLSNAVKYSEKNTEINLQVSYHNDSAVCQITDHGIGIPQEDLKKLFTSFHRASNVGNISGTGLGLSIVKNAVNLHGGQISVESQLGAGTTFTVILPLNYLPSLIPSS